jgi:hypothetical protein
MRYELSHYEWTAISVNDRRVLNGIFRVWFGFWTIQARLFSGFSATEATLKKRSARMKFTHWWLRRRTQACLNQEKKK